MVIDYEKQSAFYSEVLSEILGNGTTRLSMVIGKELNTTGTMSTSDKKQL